MNCCPNPLFPGTPISRARGRLETSLDTLTDKAKITYILSVARSKVHPRFYNRVDTSGAWIVHVTLRNVKR